MSAEPVSFYLVGCYLSPLVDCCHRLVRDIMRRRCRRGGTDGLDFITEERGKIIRCKLFRLLSVYRLSPALHSAESATISSNCCQLFSKNAKLHGYGGYTNSPTSTDRQTDGRTDGRLATAKPRCAEHRAVKSAVSSSVAYTIQRNEILTLEMLVVEVRLNNGITANVIYARFLRRRTKHDVLTTCSCTHDHTSTV